MNDAPVPESSPLSTPVTETSPTSAPIAEHPEFLGSGAEYFRIWIVNFCLTLVTLGIYIPWAKVRTRRYFYRQTRLGSHHFDYLADPKKLLIGYLIVGGLFLLYTLGEFIAIWLPILVFLLGALAYPWIRWKSARFFAANSSFRNLTFSFNGGLKEAYKIFLGYPLLGVLTAGLLYPWVAFHGRRYFFGNFHYGTSPSAFNGNVGFFYRVYLIAFGIASGVAFVLFIIFMVVVGIGAAKLHQSSANDWPPAQTEYYESEGNQSMENEVTSELDEYDIEDLLAEFDFSSAGAALALGVFVILPVFYLCIFIGFAILRIVLLNYCWSNVQVNTPAGAVTFKSQINPIRYSWIQSSNLILSVVTVGIYIPFAKVRIHRYRIKCLTVYDALLAESSKGAEQASVGALGETASDWLDFDFGL